MTTSVLERSTATLDEPTAGAPARGRVDAVIVAPAPRGYVRATLGLFALWAIVVAVGIVMQSGPALSFG